MTTTNKAWSFDTTHSGIGFAVRLVAQLSQGAGGDHLAVVDDADAMAQMLGDLEHVGRQKYGMATVDERDQQVFHQARAARVET